MHEELRRRVADFLAVHDPATTTRAVPDGDTWVVNGQRVWTSVAHNA